VPGYRVFRWERAWHDERQPFIDPAGFPPLSVATTGTHDIEPLAVWWDELNRADRLMLSQMESLRLAAPLSDLVTSPFDDRLRDAFLALLYGAGSDLLLLPVQDVFGWRERINVPATTTADNWTYRLPWSLEQFGTEPVAQERARFLAELAVRTGRSPEGQ
jgi:4-alpha-glucanotransferase